MKPLSGPGATTTIEPGRRPVRSGLFLANSSGGQLTEVAGARCQMMDDLSAFCREESTYSPYNGSFTSKTNWTNPDSDGEGLTDFLEVHGWPIRYLNATSAVKDNYTMSNPNMKDGVVTLGAWKPALAGLPGSRKDQFE